MLAGLGIPELPAAAMTDTRRRPGDSLRDLADLLRAFARARDWEQYHTPKNLAMALAGETGELLACFQWLTPGESARIMQDPTTAAAVESELADVLQYLIRLADVLGIDLAEAVRKKVQLNESRFPPSQPGDAEDVNTAESSQTRSRRRRARRRWPGVSAPGSALGGPPGTHAGPSPEAR